MTLTGLGGSIDCLDICLDTCGLLNTSIRSTPLGVMIYARVEYREIVHDGFMSCH
jgi:hypothetical protein